LNYNIKHLTNLRVNYIPNDALALVNKKSPNNNCTIS